MYFGIITFKGSWPDHKDKMLHSGKYLNQIHKLVLDRIFQHVEC